MRANRALVWLAQQPLTAISRWENGAGFVTSPFSEHGVCGSDADSPRMADAIRRRQGIAVFEVTQPRVLALLLTLPTTLMVLLVTPLLCPFHWSRLLWTYLIPLVPLITLFDGLVSCLRTYSVQELHDLAARLDPNDYH